MPIVFDSVFTAALARELDENWAGRRLEAARFDREARRVEFGFREETWVWLLHPREGVLTPLPESAGEQAATRGGRDGGRGVARGVLAGPRRVISVQCPVDTRRLFVRLAGPEDTDERLVVELVTNRWNALHVVDGRVRAVLVSDLGRSPVRPGAEWDPPGSNRRWAAAPPRPAEWSRLMADLAEEPGARARRHVAWLSGMNEAAVLGGGPRAAAAGEEAGKESLQRYLELRDAALRDPPAGWLLPQGGGNADEPAVRPYPWSLGRPDAELAGSIVDALAAYGDRSPRIRSALRAASEDPEARELRQALESRRDRMAKKIRALEVEVETVRDPEELRRLGHLLLARKSAVPAGAEEVRLEDFTGKTVRVELDPRLNAVGNAEALYDRAKRLERAAAALPRRIDKARRQLALIDNGLKRLGSRGPDAELWKLVGGRRQVLGPARGSGGQDSDAGRLPYRVYRTSSGLEIRAGRTAKANDELTFRHSAPDDIWMHVREAPGSHVVLRWGRKDQNPPESDIAEAALVAAVLSRARGSTIVPVAWTRRKHVRKPRKSAPGAVIPERTRTVFVEPDAKRVERMAEQEA